MFNQESPHFMDEGVVLSRSEDSKRRILLAALKEFSKNGLDGARVDEIADRAQINKRMIYQYFENKEGLYKEVLRYTFGKIYTISKGAFQTGADFKENVTRIVREYFYFLANNRDFVRIVSWESLNGGRYARLILPEFLDLIQPELKELLDQGRRTGLLRKDLDLRQVLLSIQGLCLIYFTRYEFVEHLWKEDMMSPEMLEKRFEHVMESIFSGVLS